MSLVGSFLGNGSFSPSGRVVTQQLPREWIGVAFAEDWVFCCRQCGKGVCRAVVLYQSPSSDGFFVIRLADVHTLEFGRARC